jgi:hypothetical protein
MKKLEQQINQGASQGYRILPNTVAPKTRVLTSGDVIVIMEKGPRYPGTYEYLLLDASLGSTMQVTLANSLDKGYEIISLLKKKKEILLVLEKKSG